MRHLLLLAVLAPAIATAQTVPAKKPPAKCERPSARQVAGNTKPGIRKLGDMPPAQPIYTVLREIDGCPIPVSVQRR